MENRQRVRVYERFPYRLQPESAYLMRYYIENQETGTLHVFIDIINVIYQFYKLQTAPFDHFRIHCC